MTTISTNKRGSGRIPDKMWLCVLAISLISSIAFVPIVDAGCSCSAVGDWEAKAAEFLKIDDTSVAPSSSSDAQNTTTTSQPKTHARSESFPNGDILKPMKSVSSSDVVLDVSNGENYARSHIKNAIHIPTRDFLDGNGKLKSSQELAQVLGDAGISRDNSVVVYGTSESSGEAEFAFFVLRYLGQREVQLLDGSLADWQAAGLPVESSESKRPRADYIPELQSEVIAKYDYVKSNKAQIVDARPFVEFGKGRIPGSTALDPATIIKGEKIKNVDDLRVVFDRLSKDRPIVVYSSDYSRSSLVWYALQLMGYKASIYTWEDWKEHDTANSQTAAITSMGSSAGSKFTKLGS